MTNEELRIAIAIAKAKGWKLYVLDRFGEKGLQALYSPESGKIKSAVQIDIRELDIGKLTNLEYLPDWPNDIAVAWELVEEMTRPNPETDVFGIRVQFNHADGWSCIWSNSSNEYDFADADAPARAICLAWLAWKAAQG